jgi:hypothetical protein
LFLCGGYVYLEWGVLVFATRRFWLNWGWSFKVRELACPQLTLPDACGYEGQGKDICT